MAHRGGAHNLAETAPSSGRRNPKSWPRAPSQVHSEAQDCNRIAYGYAGEALRVVQYDGSREIPVSTARRSNRSQGTVQMSHRGNPTMTPRGRGRGSMVAPYSGTSLAMDMPKLCPWIPVRNRPSSSHPRRRLRLKRLGGRGWTDLMTTQSMGNESVWARKKEPRHRLSEVVDCMHIYTLERSRTRERGSKIFGNGIGESRSESRPRSST